MAETLDATVDLLRILGNESRLRILLALAGRELCVCELVDALGRAHYAVSPRPRRATEGRPRSGAAGRVVGLSLHSARSAGRRLPCGPAPAGGTATSRLARSAGRRKRGSCAASPCATGIAAWSPSPILRCKRLSRGRAPSGGPHGERRDLRSASLLPRPGSAGRPSTRRSWTRRRRSSGSSPSSTGAFGWSATPWASSREVHAAARGGGAPEGAGRDGPAHHDRRRRAMKEKAYPAYAELRAWIEDASAPAAQGTS